MKVLVIGSGGREHALVWKLKQSTQVTHIFCAPGNAGTAQMAENVPIAATDITKLVEWAKLNTIDWTIVGPEQPLVAGIVDTFHQNKLKIFGPNKASAKLEGSKVFAKLFMEKYNIPTAPFKICQTIEEARQGISQFDFPLVIKADGLAAGKGVLICNDSQEAEEALKLLMEEKKFGKAGDSILLEAFLPGKEASLICILDGNHIIPLESASDYKRALDGDLGLNTGGMGCYSPNTMFNNSAIRQKIKQTILDPILKGLEQEHLHYQGVLFIGLMIHHDQINVLEFNVRFGDPETQVILPRLQTDFIDVLSYVHQGNLQPQDLTWHKDKSICVILASKGYPNSYEKEKLITGFEKIDQQVIPFHAGTENRDSKIFTSGGRVLGITALAASFEQARKLAYSNCEKIYFEGMHFRKDIGQQVTFST